MEEVSKFSGVWQDGVLTRGAVPKGSQLCLEVIVAGSRESAEIFPAAFGGCEYETVVVIDLVARRGF